MKENKTNWLYVEFGSRGEKEEIKWVNDKTFDEIVKIGEEEYEENRKEIMSSDDGGYEYFDEFCCWSSRLDVGVEYMLNEECGVGYYRESVVREVIGVDLDKLNEEGWKMVDNIIDRVDGSSFEE